jgi:hypothetical protein
MDPFMHQFRKFWPGENITLVAEDKFTSSSNVNFMRLPDYLLKHGECPAKKFSNSLIWALQNTPNKYAIILLADYWFYKPVLLEPLQSSLDYLKAHPEVIRIDVAERPRAGELKEVSKHIFECAQKRDCFFPISLTPGMWNKDRYLDLLDNDLDPWKTELVTHNKFMHHRTDMRSLWCEPGPIHYTNVLRGRDNGGCVCRRETYDEMKQWIPSHFKLYFEN